MSTEKEFDDEQAIPSSLNETGKLNRAEVDTLLRTCEAIRRAHPDVFFEDSAELIREEQIPLYS